MLGKHSLRTATFRTAGVAGMMTILLGFIPGQNAFAEFINEILLREVIATCPSVCHSLVGVSPQLDDLTKSISRTLLRIDPHAKGLEEVSLHSDQDIQQCIQNFLIERKAKLEERSKEALALSVGKPIQASANSGKRAIYKNGKIGFELSPHPHDLEYAKKHHTFFGNEELARLPKGAVYNFVMTAYGELVFGQVNDSWEIGVGHLDLAQGQKAYGAGQIFISKDGKVSFNLKSSVFEQKDSIGPRRQSLQKLFSKEVGNDRVEYTDHDLSIKSPPTLALRKEFCEDHAFSARNQAACDLTRATVEVVNRARIGSSSEGSDQGTAGGLGGLSGLGSESFSNSPKHPLQRKVLDALVAEGQRKRVEELADANPVVTNFASTQNPVGKLEPDRFVAVDLLKNPKQKGKSDPQSDIERYMKLVEDKAKIGPILGEPGVHPSFAPIRKELADSLENLRSQYLKDRDLPKYLQGVRELKNQTREYPEVSETELKAFKDWQNGILDFYALKIDLKTGDFLKQIPHSTYLDESEILNNIRLHEPADQPELLNKLKALRAKIQKNTEPVPRGEKRYLKKEALENLLADSSLPTKFQDNLRKNLNPFYRVSEFLKGAPSRLPMKQYIDDHAPVNKDAQEFPSFAFKGGEGLENKRELVLGTIVRAIGMNQFVVHKEEHTLKGVKFFDKKGEPIQDPKGISSEWMSGDSLKLTEWFGYTKAKQREAELQFRLPYDEGRLIGEIETQFEKSKKSQKEIATLNHYIESLTAEEAAIRNTAIKKGLKRVLQQRTEFEVRRRTEIEKERAEKETLQALKDQLSKLRQDAKKATETRIEAEEKMTKERDRANIQSLAFLDGLLFSFDSHQGQYKDDNGKLKTFDFARFLPPAETIHGRGGTYIPLKSAMMDHPFAEARMAPALVQQINDIDLKGMRAALAEAKVISMSLESETKRKEEFRAQRNRLEQLKQEQKRIEAASKEDGEFKKLLEQHQVEGADFESRKKALVSAILEAKTNIRAQQMEQIDPHALEGMVRGIEVAKQYVKEEKEPTVRGLFLKTHPDFVPFFRVMERMDPKGSFFSAGFKMNEQFGNLAPRSLEQVIEDAKKNNLATETEIHEMEAALARLKKRSATFTDLSTTMDIESEF